MIINYRNHFGVYDIVNPVKTTPSRIVPDHIEKPNYVIGKALLIPTRPEVKDVNQMRGMKRSCKLASNILSQVPSVVKVTIDKFLDTENNNVPSLPAKRIPVLMYRVT